jgi:tetratricopeptide (TPR) repeat protein
MSLTLKYYLFISVFILNTLTFFASEFQDKQVDSLLKVASKNAYENPKETIEVSLSIFNNETYSLITRTRALMTLSLGYNSKRDYKKALEYIVKANEFVKLIDDKKLQIEIQFMTGIQYQQLKIYDKAIEYMEEIEREVLIYPERDSLSSVLASSYLVKGFIYKDNLNCDIALEYFNKALKEFERTGGAFHNRSIGYYNKGNCQILISEYTNAKESFNKAIEFANRENASSLVSFAEKGMAEVYTLEGRNEEAISLLQSALDKSKNVGDLILNLGIYKGLFENYLVLNKWDDYQKYYELFLKTQLEIKISERNSVSITINEDSKIFNEELNLIQSKFNNVFKLIILIVFIFVFVVLILEIKNKKIIKALQKKIESFQNTNPPI